jgi:hypothetical protein
MRVDMFWLSEIFRDSPPYVAAIVGRIANPTHIWRVTTLILREPMFFKLGMLAEMLPITPSLKLYYPIQLRVGGVAFALFLWGRARTFVLPTPGLLKR